MKQLKPLTITNGQLVTPGGVSAGAIRLVDGRIAALGDIAPEDGDEVINAGGKLIAPGLIDCGVFAIDKPAFHFGGITRAALMPDQVPPLDYPERVKFVAMSGKPDLWVHPLAAATRGLDGQRLSELALLRDAGARAVATGRQWIGDSGVMLRVLQYAAMLDLPVIAHAEDAALVGEAAATAGEMASRMGLPSAPAQAEALAVARDIAPDISASAISRWRRYPARGCISGKSRRAARLIWLGLQGTAAYLLPPALRPRISCCLTSRQPNSAHLRASPRRCATKKIGRQSLKQSAMAPFRSSLRDMTRADPKTSACRSRMRHREWQGQRRCSRWSSPWCEMV